MDQHDAHQQGVVAALQAYGLCKQAGISAGGVRRFLVGDPRKYWNQLNSGKLFTRHGEIARMIDPRVPGSPKVTALNTLLNVGLPAYGLYSAASAPESSRGSAVGSALGGLAGGLVGNPLGLLGNLAGGTAGAALGEGLGRTFNRAPASNSRQSEFQR